MADTWVDLVNTTCKSSMKQQMENSTAKQSLLKQMLSGGKPIMANIQKEKEALINASDGEAIGWKIQTDINESTYKTGWKYDQEQEEKLDQQVGISEQQDALTVPSSQLTQNQLAGIYESKMDDMQVDMAAQFANQFYKDDNSGPVTITGLEQLVGSTDHYGHQPPQKMQSAPQAKPEKKEHEPIESKEREFFIE